MTVYVETEHPRTGDGKFTVKPVTEAAGGLAALTAVPSALPSPQLRPAPSVSDQLIGPVRRVQTSGGNGVEYRDAEGRLHREDGPASSWDGGELWYLHGERHREDGPALVMPGHEEWHLHGKRHRIGGPAIVIEGQIAGWYVEGKQHREDGPAVVRDREYASSIFAPEEEWYRNGELHREDGPAVTALDMASKDASTPKRWYFIAGRDVTPRPEDRWHNSEIDHRHEMLPTEALLAEPVNGWRREFDPKAREFVVHTPSGELRRYQWAGTD